MATPDQVCPSCGKENQRGAGFCNFCGAAFPKSQPPMHLQYQEQPQGLYDQQQPQQSYSQQKQVQQPTQAQQPQQPSYRQPQRPGWWKRQSRGRKLLWVLLALAVLLVIIIVAATSWNGPGLTEAPFLGP